MFVMFWFVSTVIEFPIEQLDCYNSEDEHEEHVDHQYRSHIFEGIDHTHEDCLKRSVSYKVHVNFTL